MTIYDKYFLYTMITIIVTRVLVYLFNKPSPTIKILELTIGCMDYCLPFYFFVYPIFIQIYIYYQ